MNSDGMLFSVSETLSPKLRWMREHKLELTYNSEIGQWVAMTPENPPVHTQIGLGDTPEDALVDWARKHKVLTWQDRGIGTHEEESE